jgi:hypothetical protein
MINYFSKFKNFVINIMCKNIKFFFYIYLMCFLTILEGFSYAWYRFYNVTTFNSWQELHAILFICFNLLIWHKKKTQFNIDVQYLDEFQSLTYFIYTHKN